MEIKKSYAVLGSPLFIISVVLLLVNDHYLKPACPGFVTGKLSDVAGLFAFATFLSALFERRRLAVHIITAIGFILWKLPAADLLIDAANTLLPFTIGRSVDYGDLWALLVLPASYAYASHILAKEVRFEESRMRFIRHAMALVAGIAFCASVTVPIPTIKQYYYIATPRQMGLYIDTILTRHPELRAPDIGYDLSYLPPTPRFFCRLVDSAGPEIFVVTYSDVYTASPHHQGLLFLVINHVHAEGTPYEGRREVSASERTRLSAKFEKGFISKLDLYIPQHPYP